MRRVVAAKAAWALLVFGHVAGAQLSPSSSPARPAPQAEQPFSQRELGRHMFDQGIKAFQRGALEQALDDFRQSFELVPTHEAYENVVLCLRELQRFDEALDMEEAFSRRFSDLSEEERHESEVRIAQLSAEVGWLELRGAVAGSEVTVDGRDRGAASDPSRLRLSRGRHRMRITKDGWIPFEGSAIVAAKETVTLEVRQTPVLGEWIVEAELAGTLVPSLGGSVAGCGSGCDAQLGWGGRVLGRAGRRLNRALSLSVDAGYVVLTQKVNARPTALNVVSAQDPGTAHDELSMNAGVLGLSLKYQIPSLGASFVRLGGGSLFGWVRDQRTGQFSTMVSDPGSYEIAQTQRQPAVYAYASLGAGFGIEPFAHSRIGVGFDATALVAVRQPEWDANCGADCQLSGRDGDSWFDNDKLSGNFVVLLSPFVDARYDF